MLVYQTYPNRDVAQNLLALLNEQGIAYTTDHAPARFNAALGVASAEQFVVSLRPEDFTWVRQLEEKHAVAALAELPVDYYLFQFSNAELWTLVSEPTAWGSHDVALAGRLLRERGETVSEEKLQTLRAQHTAALAAPNASPTGWIAAGYALALLGGVFGLGIGWSLLRYQKTLPDGRQVPGYSARDRAHGRRIIWVGAGGLLAWAAWKFLGLR